MKQQTAEMTRDWLPWALAGLGISLPLNVFVGGLLLAMAGAAVARRLSPEVDERELWVVILTALFIAVLVAVVYRPEWAEVVPPQFAMGASGFFSRSVARVALRIGGGFESRGDMIVDKILDRFIGKPKK